MAGGSHEFQVVHPQTVLSPLESLKEKMRLKSSEQVVTQEFYLPWESHPSLEQPLQCLSLCQALGNTTLGSNFPGQVCSSNTKHRQSPGRSHANPS